MIEMSPETEALPQAKASSNEIVRDALSRADDVLPWRSQARARPSAETKEERIACDAGQAAQVKCR